MDTADDSDQDDNDDVGGDKESSDIEEVCGTRFIKCCYSTYVKQQET